MEEVHRSVCVPLQVFVSHNKADKDFARRLALALVDQGISVWFDEWKLHPGDSIIAGVEHGLTASDVVVVVWSHNAAESHWVKAELQSATYRCISDGSVRVIPVMLDETPLPVLIADYFRVRVQSPTDVFAVAAKIVGDSTATDLARRLQNRFFEILDEIGEGVGFNDYKFCPKCGKTTLVGWQATDQASDRTYAGVRCKECGWEDGSET